MQHAAPAGPSGGISGRVVVPALATVTLRARDLDAQVAYYTQALALEPVAAAVCPASDPDLVPDSDRAVGPRPAEDIPGQVVLGRLGVPLVRLVSAPWVAAGDSPFRVGLRFEDLGALAATVYRAMQHPGTRIVDAADMLVARVVTLRDPEGNGIDLTVERDRGHLPLTADGRLRVAGHEMDLGAFLLEHVEKNALSRARRLPAHLGAVSIPVTDLAFARRACVVGLNLAVSCDGLPGSVILSTGAQVRDVTLTDATGAADPAMRRLADVEMSVPSRTELDGIAARLADLGLPVVLDDTSLVVASPSGFQFTVVLREPRPET